MTSHLSASACDEISWPIPQKTYIGELFERGRFLGTFQALVDFYCIGDGVEVMSLDSTKKPSVLGG
ncbi:hypothetical protein ccbrp13_47870 [Ktedonobacteria bacterium brp13]|nr:hypothetical protein ccbrp13_47870 [Ktedonobacteria bacterium brp13]